MGRLLILFIAVPVVELVLLIEIGQRVGTLATVGLIIGTGIVGASLARQQGISTLARLRNDMAPLGIARSAGSKEPEDHAGALMDMMAGLIEGSFGAPRPLAVQREFFVKHVGAWTPHFFADLEKAKSARLFRPVGRIGRLFMEIEEAAFAM